ncbi:transporter substrate-binding domain-containing protein [Klebsiella pneumoniae]|uniref:transporter substrate-binding domain-containing protein n=1 Tax=Klebsiella pneumoniae TaxID=573 RepID=UPI002DB76167|nr:transporter substrate-binding domain-containing protein [Klebsiella pneumoniae]MEC4509527.1 transporter substrate-binding domain-containing protein [Klebsiella pneumoniae]HDO6739789.1 transporter substrate-binding domain-containing protein [Klebsiella pneumoniae]
MHCYTKKIAIRLLILLFSTSPLLSHATSSDTLRFGTALAYAPFEYRGSDGKMTGFEIDLGNAICTQLKKQCKWVETEISTMVPALKARKYDAILASIGVTEARKKLLLFTDKVHGGGTRLIAKENSGLSPDGAQLRGKRIGVEQGSSVENFARQRWAPQGVAVVSYGNQDLVYNDLIAGRLDGMLTSEVQGQLGFLDTDKGKGFAFSGQRIQDPLIGTGVSAIAVDKSNTQLASELNSAIAALRANGTYQKIASKYFPPSIDIYQ